MANRRAKNSPRTTGSPVCKHGEKDVIPTQSARASRRPPGANKAVGRGSLIILGLDPGVARLGFGAIASSEHELKCLGYGCLTTPKELGLPERLASLMKELKKLLRKYQPDVVAVETLRFAQNQTTGIAVAEARGLILATSAEARHEVIEISPLQVKQSLTSYGQAGKDQVQLMVQRILKLPIIPKPDDAADALAAAIAVEPIYPVRNNTPPLCGGGDSLK